MRTHSALRVLSATAVLLGMLVAALPATAFASPVPPTPDRRLLGSWVNTDPATRGIKQIVIRGTSGGGISVSAFGACGGGLCEWGSVPGNVYGRDVSAGTGKHFTTNQRFVSGDSEFARTALLGRVRSTRQGLRLIVRKLTVFTDGSGRRSYTSVERFAPGEAQLPTVIGHAVNDYPQGTAPATASGLFGSWTNVSPSGSLAAIRISGTAAAPVVRAWGSCTPTPCDWGSVGGITYGRSVSSSSGKTVLAPYSFGFKDAELILRYRRLRDGREVLKVASYNEFTDGSGRANYVRTETFVRP